MLAVMKVLVRKRRRKQLRPRRVLNPENDLYILNFGVSEDE